MTTRMSSVTGLIDIDALVESQTLRYKAKINTATSQKTQQEYKQEQYRAIQTKAKTFYNKYFTSTGSSSLVTSGIWDAVKYTSSNSSAVTATGDSTAKAVNYSVKVSKLASAANHTIKTDDLGSSIKIKDSNGKEKTITVSGETNEKKAENINKELSASGMNVSVKYSDFADNGNGGFVIESKSTGKDSKITVNDIEYNNGTNSEVEITDKTTNMTKKYTEADNLKNNSVTLDGVTFKFSDVTDGNGVTLSGKNDASDLVDRISSFIDDYNELMGCINTKLYETRDKSYMPLTDDDKEGLTDSQIEKLENKAKEGLLRNDDILTNFAEDMKTTMSSMMLNKESSSYGFSLEKIGIKPVKDYSTQNGLFTIDTDKLKSAIESDPDSVKQLFLSGFVDDTEEKGILSKLEANLNYHATSTFSVLAKKAGVADGVTTANNEMSKDIVDRKKKIAEMKSALEERESNLYTKYSSLESSLSALQSQQSSLASYFTS